MTDAVTSDGQRVPLPGERLLADSLWVGGEERLALSLTPEGPDSLLVLRHTAYDAEFSPPVEILLDRQQTEWLVTELSRALGLIPPAAGDAAPS